MRAKNYECIGNPMQVPMITKEKQGFEWISAFQISVSALYCL